MLILIGFIAVTALFLLISFLRSRPVDLDFVPNNLTICAAHSDDCVIMGAEMAHRVLAEGHIVEIVYLTCSASFPDEAIAKERAEEARAAWKEVGVPAENLHFLNLPQSPLGGLPNYGVDEIDRATNWLRNHFQRLPSGSTLLIPAEGESHVDHRTIREISLRALDQAENKQGLLLYEVTEYNPYLSMFQDPLEVMNRLAFSLPLLGRILRRYRAMPGFVSGPAGASFSEPAALTFKISMLGAFPSQDPVLLRTFFGFPSRYRRIENIAQAMRPYAKRWFNLMGARVDMSVLIFFALIVLSIFGMFLVLSQVGLAVSWVIGLLMSGLLIGSLIRRRHIFAVLCAAALVGLVGGSI